MSETKWTPGPWFVNARLSGSENHKGYRIYSDSRTFYFADVIPVDPDGIEGGANANLMASAPKLYRALYRLLVICEDEFDESRVPEMKEARAALAKARGE